MMRVVLDTNVYISALLFGGKPLQVLGFAEEHMFSLLYSKPIREEVEGVLAKKFHWPQEMINLACEPYWKIGLAVRPKRRVSACPDPDDNRVLECAIEARADWIVTGDKHLLDMLSFEGISILRPDDFLKHLLR